jgi:hypothetical protein
MAKKLQLVRSSDNITPSSRIPRMKRTNVSAEKNERALSGFVVAIYSLDTITFLFIMFN